jgi:hypothetical protein
LLPAPRRSNPPLAGKPCANPLWVAGESSSDGQSSLTCVSQTDVAGIRSVFVCVGGQGYMTARGDLVRVAGALMAGQERGAWNTAGKPALADSRTVHAVAVGRCVLGGSARD